MPPVLGLPALRVPAAGLVTRRLRTVPRSRLVRFASSSSSSSPGRGPRRSGGRIIRLAAVAVASGALVWAYPFIRDWQTAQAPPPPLQQAEIEFEKERRAPRSKEDNRGLISSQHVQVQKSWESPGVYAWGSNAGHVVAPESTAGVVRSPKRIPFFDGRLLRDLKIDRDAGAAVLENGNLVQWGTAFAPEATEPVVTLRGRDLVRVALSRDRVIGLSSNGTVYSLSVSQADQKVGNGQGSSFSWIPFWSPAAPAGYRTITPGKLGWGERVVDIRSGREHGLLLTSSGRVFSLASSTEEFPSKGQLGIPGLTWSTKPKGPFDQPHEVSMLRGFKIAKIATGDFHSVVLDGEGRVFAFGDNSSGQLGLQTDPDIPFVDSPALLPFNKLYNGTGLVPRVTSIAAGGSNTFFTVDALRTGSQEEQAQDGPARALGKVVADTWACGEGISGALGTGRWTHISQDPTKIKALSGLYEYNEHKNQVVPIRLSRIAVGSNHVSAVMDNVTNVSASKSSSDNDTNWGADIVFWGGNEFYQLGTGKRNNANAPLYIAPLDGGEGDAEKGRKGEEHRFQITPRKTVRLGPDGQGRRASVEQRVECGRYVTAVYSGT